MQPQPEQAKPIKAKPFHEKAAHAPAVRAPKIAMKEHKPPERATKVDGFRAPKASTPHERPVKLQDKALPVSRVREPHLSAPKTHADMPERKAAGGKMSFHAPKEPKQSPLGGSSERKLGGFGAPRGAKFGGF